VNTQSKGEEGFTALHFASFSGNLAMMRLLIEHGGEIHAKNKQSINLLHVAAQGDQPAALTFLRHKGLDINSRDKKESTPLHWAAFSGAELALSYILSWEADVDAQDIKGLTPLHLAVRASEDIRSTRSIRHLLMKGANKNLEDIEGRRAIDMIEEIRTPAMKEDIRKILDT